MEHSCLFSDSTLPCWPLTKYATILAKGIHSFKYILPLWFFYSLCCFNMVTFVKNINCLTLSSLRCFGCYYRWYSNHREGVVCSALIPHLSPNSNELKGSFHTNCFFQDDNPRNKLQRGVACLRGNTPKWNKHPFTFDLNPFSLGAEYMPAPGQNEGEEVWINISY